MKDYTLTKKGKEIFDKVDNCAFKLSFSTEDSQESFDKAQAEFISAKLDLREYVVKLERENLGLRKSLKNLQKR